MTIEKSLDIDVDLLRKGRMILRALNHPLRQQMLQLIHNNKRMIVTEIYSKLQLEQSVASQHLAILRREGFVLTERQSKFIFYSVNYQRIEHVQTVAGGMDEFLKDRK